MLGQRHVVERHVGHHIHFHFLIHGQRRHHECPSGYSPDQRTPGKLSPDIEGEFAGGEPEL